MTTVFWDSEGVVLVDFLEGKKTVIGAYYIEVLRKLRAKLAEKRSGKLHCGILFHGWNVWKRVSGVICDRRLPARVKGKVYSSVVRPAMMYGLEMVAVTKKQVEEMEVTEMKMLEISKVILETSR